MRILIVNDETSPGRSGSHEFLTGLVCRLSARRHLVECVAPSGRTRFFAERRIADAAHGLYPEAVHIMTDGPYGKAAARYCKRFGFPFTTLLSQRDLPASDGIFSTLRLHRLRKFHSHAKRVLVPSPATKGAALSLGFKDVHVWSPNLRPLLNSSVSNVLARDGAGAAQDKELFPPLWDNFADRFVELLVKFQWYEPPPSTRPEETPRFFHHVPPMCLIRIR